MKKWILSIVFILLLVAIVIGGIYGKQILVSTVNSTLASQYQINLLYDDVDLALFAGGISFDELKINYTKPDPPILLASAGTLDIGFSFWKAIQGQPELSNVHSDRFQMEMAHNPDGSLPIANAINKVRAGEVENPNKAIAQSDSNSPPSAPLPKITLENSSFAYIPNAQNAKKQHIQLGEATINFTQDRLQLGKVKIYQEGEQSAPLLGLEQASLSSLMKQEQPIGLEAKDLAVVIREIGDDRYNLNQTLNAWQSVIDKIVPAQKTEQDKSQSASLSIGKSAVSGLSLTILPQNGDASAEGAMTVNVKSAELENNGDQITLNEVKITESGQETIQFKNLTFSGTQKGFVTLDAVTLEDAEVTIRENAEKNLNIVRMIERIKSIINSVIQNESGKKVASSAETPLPSIQVKNTKFSWVKSDRTGHQISLQELSFSPQTKEADIKDFLVAQGIDNVTRLLHAPILSVTGIEPKESRIGGILADKLKVHGIYSKENNSLNNAIADWSSLPSRLFPSDPPKKKKATKPFAIQHIALKGTRLELVNSTLAKTLNLIIDPMELQWANIQFGEATSWGDFSLLANTLAPTPGLVELQGKVASLWSPMNIDLQTIIQIEKLTEIMPYLGKEMRIGILNSGLNLNGHFKVDKNMLDSTFDLIMKNPEFTEKPSEWGIKVNSKAAVQALNGMRNNEGDIIFRNNHLKGNIMNPEFNFGTSIVEMLGRNLMNRMKDVITLPLDVAGKGANLVGDGAKGVKEGVEGVFKGIFGGLKKQEN